MKVLIAEDNADSRQLVEDLLQNLGCDILTAPDGVTALDLARAEHPDLVILDINMPGMTGFDVCAHIKAQEDLASIPVLMLTALDEVEARIKGLRLGADDYLTKPFNPRELIARVSTRLRAKQVSDELRAAQQQIRSTFERYVAAEVVEQLLADPSQVALGGRLQEITVLFADLQGFSTLSENMNPEVVIAVLNRYLKLIAQVIKDHGGTIDKYLGDGLMALFNTPLPQHDHALRAVTAAISVHQQLEAFHQGFEPNTRLGVNFGIHTGPAVVGNVGTDELMNFTAIGDTVNTASRIQGLSHDNKVLISQATYNQVKDDVVVRELGPHQVKGREEPVQLYEVLQRRA